MKESENPREIALHDFLKSFRIALNFITLYSKGHKSFIAAINGLKLQVDLLLASASPLVIVFFPDALSVDGIRFEKKQLYLDLGRQFHFRKVRSLQLNQGITLQELSAVLETVSLPVKEIISRGGMAYLLAVGGTTNVQVEELDYSSLLDQEGGVAADVGAFLLHQSLQSRDPEKIKEFARHFESAISHISIKKIAEDKQLAGNLRKFIEYLHAMDKESVQRCLKSLFRIVQKNKEVATKEQMAVFVGIVKELSDESISDMIVNEALANEAFNNENLALFLRELDTGRNRAIKASLAKRITEDEAASRLSAKASLKIKELFTISDAPLIAGLYERVMETLSRNTSLETAVTFDREHALHNYRSILVFVLGTEQDPQRLEDVAQKISADWQIIVRAPNPDYFRALSAALALQRGQPGAGNSLAHLDHLFRRFLEESVWKSPMPEWLAGLMDGVQESTMDGSWYLEKMFGGGGVTRHAVSLFLRLFPEEVEHFCAHLALSGNDTEFMGTIVEELKFVRSPLVIFVMEQVYSFSNDLVKSDVLKAMQVFPDRDESFLLPILSQDKYVLRKEAMIALMSGPQSRDKALDVLLRDDDLWGRKNARVKENIGIVEELAVREAKPLLERLARKPFFWNAAVRRSARKALEVLA